jgi:hypothetical protein
LHFIFFSTLTFPRPLYCIHSCYTLLSVTLTFDVFPSVFLSLTLSDEMSLFCYCLFYLLQFFTFSSCHKSSYPYFNSFIINLTTEPSDRKIHCLVF